MRHPASHSVPLAFVALLSSAPAPAPASELIDLRLPSQATGGGTLALRVYTPDPGAERYPSGAPVLVSVPGGWDSGNLRGLDAVLEHGVAVVAFLFPGGSWNGIESDGVYDTRGPLCNQALAEVISFALGTKTESGGQTIDEVVSAEFDLNVVGIGASSNGGPVTAAALGRYGDQLDGLGFFAGWENPTSAQVLGMDFGPHDCDPRDGDGNGNDADDHRTDAYVAYGFPTCEFDLEGLTWEPDVSWQDGRHVRQGALYLERGANGSYDVVDRFGCISGDLDDSGVLEPDEDQAIPALFHDDQGQPQPLRYYSPTVLRAALAQGSFDATGWPPFVATLGEATGFWFHRDATQHYAAMAAKLPALGGILVFSEQDHVQITPDRVHIHHTYDGFRDGGLWCRLNPDANYVAITAPGVPFGDLPDTPANAEVADWTVGAGFALPEHAALSSSAALAAAVLELADRTHRGDWSDDLGRGRHAVVGRRR